MKNKDQALKLLDQILLKAESDDVRHKAKMIKAGEGSKSVGTSWLIFHLKELKALIEKNK